MMHYPPPYDNTPIKPEEQRRRELRYRLRIQLALARYAAWKTNKLINKT